MEKKNEIKSFCNMYMYSDVLPFEVVKTISNQTVEVRPMKHEQTVFPEEIHLGGFMANVADNWRQAYNYTSDEEALTRRVRWSKAKQQWQSHGSRFIMEDKPVYFYDYNF